MWNSLPISIVFGVNVFSQIHMLGTKFQSSSSDFLSKNKSEHIGCMGLFDIVILSTFLDFLEISQKQRD